MEGLGIMFNAIDHFSIVDPRISAATLHDACRVLKLALNGEPLPAPWICVQGAAPSAPTADPFPIDDGAKGHAFYGSLAPWL